MMPSVSTKYSAASRGCRRRSKLCSRCRPRRVVDPSLLGRLPDAADLVLGRELGRLDADADQPVVSIGLRPGAMYGSVHSQLMQVSVQKSTRMTWPRRSAGPSGSESSHSVAPPSEGMCTWANTVHLAKRPERRANLF